MPGSACGIPGPSARRRIAHVHASTPNYRRVTAVSGPVPRTRYLNEVSCSTPTGPRACIWPVAMPISAPMPNSPPSANWVEALCSTIALIDLGEEALDGRRRPRRRSPRCAASRSARCARWRRATPSTSFTAMMASRYSVDQSSSVAGLARGTGARTVVVAAHFAAGLAPARRASAPDGWRATARSTSSVSAAPQTPVRRILALRTIAHRHVEIGRLVDIDVADAFEMREHRHARLRLHAGDEALAAARHDDVDGAVEARQHLADGRAVGGRHELDRVLRQAGRLQALDQAGMDGARRNEPSPSRRAGSRHCRP